MWYWLSGVPFGNDGNLHTGVMIGKDRNTERKTRTTFVLCLLLWEGCTREIFWGSGGGDGNVEEFWDVDVVEEFWDVEVCDDDDDDLGSPIGWWMRTGKRRSMPSERKRKVNWLQQVFRIERSSFVLSFAA